jgi:hypothetical protein
MKKIGLLMAVAAVMCLATGADAEKNANGKWALHYAGIHNSKTNDCSFVLDACGSIQTTGPSSVAAEHHDIYVIAVDVAAIAGARYGLVCDGSFFFYSWQNCADLEIPTAGWPGCGESNAQTFFAEKPGPHVTLGIIELYVYPGANSMSTTIDTRTGINFASWCDGSEPSPICFETDGSDTRYFGQIGFNGQTGSNPCGIVPTEIASWGKLKAMYH